MSFTVFQTCMQLRIIVFFQNHKNVSNHGPSAQRPGCLAMWHVWNPCPTYVLWNLSHKTMFNLCRNTSLWSIQRTQSGSIWKERIYSEMPKTLHQNMWPSLWTMWHSNLHIMHFLRWTWTTQKRGHFENTCCKERKNPERITGIGLCCGSCLSDNEFWICGWGTTLRLYDLQGNLLKPVQTKSGNRPRDITVTKNRDLVYIDCYDRSINIVKNSQIRPLITLRGWQHLHICSTSSGDLLVTMVSNDYKQSKIVRYFGPTEIQSIQWDDQGKALYSSDIYCKYLSENRNLDICVADSSTRVVVVVSAAGILRFRYTGPPTNNTKIPFKPSGITTDSQGRILTSDRDNNRIHIVEQDGNFLRHIDNIILQEPACLCVDSRGNLFVAEFVTGRLKKVQYYKWAQCEYITYVSYVNKLLWQQNLCM